MIRGSITVIMTVASSATPGSRIGACLAVGLKAAS